MAVLDGTPYLMEGATCASLLARVRELDGKVGALRANGKLDSATLQALRREWGVQNVYESAGIEGNQLDLSETMLAISRGITISGKPPEHSDEVRNLHEAHEYLEQLVQEAAPVTEFEIREIQSLIVGQGQPDRGAYRSVEVVISGATHKPSHPGLVPGEMTELAAWIANSEDDPVVIRAAILHAWFTHIHPFRDGNGRTARAITNLLLIRHGYPVVVIRRKDRQRYYEALRYSDDGDLLPFLDLLVERVQNSLQQIDRIRTAQTGMSLAAQVIRQQEERRYQVWLDGMRLFGSTLEESLQQFALADPAVTLHVQHYDIPNTDDFREMCAGDAFGNTWFRKVVVERGGVRGRLLLWFGFSSDALGHQLGLNRHIPVLKVSAPNPAGTPPWTLPGPEFPSSAREFAYHEGKYHRVNNENSVVTFESPLVLASEFAQELLLGWFAG